MPQQLGVCRPGRPSQDVPPSASLHAVGGIQRTRLVNQQRPWQLGSLDIGHCERPRLKRDHQDMQPQRLDFLFVLSQLRQMLSARQSPEMPVKNQQQPVAPVVFQPVRVPLRVMQRKWHGRFAGSILHQCLLICSF